MTQTFLSRFLPLEQDNCVFDDPIKRLLIAVLYRALLDLSDHRVVAYEFRHDGSPAMVRDFVFKWIMSDREHDENSFTFLQICDVLKLDPEAARKEILESRYVSAAPTSSSKEGAIRGRFRFTW